MKNFLFILFISLFVLSAKAQNQEIDSLKRVLETTEIDTQKVNILNQLAYAFRAVNPNEQIRYGKEALSISENSNYDLGRSRSLNQIGSGYSKEGRYDSAKLYINESILLLETLNSIEDKVEALTILGEVERKEGNFTKATEYYLEALELEERYNVTKNKAGIINNLAIVFYYQQNYTKALEYYKRSYQLAKELGEDQNMAMALYNIGGIFEDNLGILDSALIYTKKSLEISEQLNIPFGIGVNKGAISSIYSKQGNYTEALPMLISAIEALEKSNRKPMINTHIIMLGELYTAMGSTKKAEETLLKISAEVSSKKNLRRVELALSQLYEKSNQWEKALEHYKVYRIYDDSLLNDSKSKEVLELQTKYESEKKEQENQTLKDKAKINEQKLLISRGFILSLSILALLMAALAYFFFRTLKLKKKINTELREMNEKIMEQKEELQSQSSNLSQANVQLKKQHEELETALADLKNTQSQLVQSEKMASLGILSAGIGHEINNPLNFIKNGTIGLTKKLKKAPEYEKSDLKPFVEIINEGVERATAIVKSLGQFSRTGASFDEVIKIHDILDNCLVILESQLKNRVKVIKNYTMDNPQIHGNGGKLHQAILNIISNAEHAINGEGVIEISTLEHKGYTVIKVKDSGSGIDKSISTKISDPFFTTKAPGIGVGLGLFITYSIIEEHNGKIKFNSEPGKGTEFIIKFPQ